MNWVQYWSKPAMDDPFWEKTTGFYAHNLFNLIDIKKDWSVLDYGSGPGFIGKFIADRVKNITLIEPSSALLEKSISFNAEKNNIHHLHIDDINKLTDYLDNNKFDLILINSVSQYIDYDEFKNILNILKGSLNKNGIIIISDIIPLNSYFLKELSSVIRHYSNWFGYRKLFRYLVLEFLNIRLRKKLRLYKYSEDSFETLLGGSYKIVWLKNPTLCTNRLCAMLSKT